MSKTENRRINIYINGKEVENSIRSIRKESRKLRNEIENKLTPGTKKYNKAVQELKRVNGVIQNHTDKLRGTSGIWGKISKEVKQFGILAAGALGLGGLITGFQKLLKTSADLDEQLADVRKVTGLTKDEVKDLASELKKIDTRSSRSELLELSWMAGKLGIQGKESIMGFVRAADQINVALGKDLGDTAVREIGKLVNIFDLESEFGIEEGMLKIASTINEIGMASTASEGFLVSFLQRMSGISGIANISAADNIALAGTLDSLGQKAETSSTAISKTLITMAKSPEEYAKVAGIAVKDFSSLMEENALNALLLVLEGVGETEGGIEALAATLGDLGADGGRVVGVLGTLAGNIDEVRRQQEIANNAFDAGVSVTNEFNIKNETLGAVLAKLKKEIAQMIAPVALIEGLKTFFYWLSQNIKEIINAIKITLKLIAVYLTYAGVMKGVNALLLVYNNRKTVGIVLTNAQRIATILLYKAKKILAMNINSVAKAMRLLNLVTKLNPYALIIGLLAAAATAFVLFNKKVKETTLAQRVLNDVRAEAEKSVVKEKASLDTLIRIAKDETLSKWDRQKAIRAINDISPEYLDNITLENINTKKSTEAINDYIEALDRKALAKALDSRKQELYLKLVDAENKANKDNVKWYQKVGIAIFDSAHLQDYHNKVYAKGSRNKLEYVNAIKEEIDALNELIKTQISVDDVINSIEEDGGNGNSREMVNELEKDIEAFYKFLDDMRIENLTKSMNENEKAVNDVKRKYDEQLKIAKVFWGIESDQYKEMLNLRNEEIQEIEDAFAEENEEKKLERIREFADKWKELNDEIWLESIDDLREKALGEIALQEEAEIKKYEHLEDYEELKALVVEKYRLKRKNVNDKFDKAEIDGEKAKAATQRNIQIQAMDSTADMLGSIAGLLTQGTGAWKALKLAETKISMFTAIQKAYESAMELPFPVNLIVGATSIAAATAQGIAGIMSIQNTEIPAMPQAQFKTGGYDVVGPSDGKNYNATFLNQKGGHVGKNGPNLVLGGEDKPEYWINGDMMQNPYIARVAGALEAYRTHKISTPDFQGMMQTISMTQMKSGGYTQPTSKALNAFDGSKATNSEFSFDELISTMKRINEVLENPPASAAILDYDYFEKESDFMDKIKDNARG